MKSTNLFILSCLTLLLFLSIPVYAQQIPKVNVALLSQDPDPVEPGQLVELRFKIENLGDGSLSGITVSLNPEFPFTVTNASQYIGNVAGNQRGDNIHTFKFNVLVSPDAVEKDYNLDVTYKAKDGSGGRSAVSVKVRSVDSNVIIENFKTVPERLEPGQEGSIAIRIKNLDNLLVRDVSLKLDLSATTLPIAPVNTASEQSVKLIKPGSDYLFMYNIIPFADADSKIYKIPVVLTYFDASGNKFNKSDVISVMVGKEPELQVIIDSSDMNMPGKVGNVVFRISNSGVSDVKFLTVTLQSENVEVIGSSSLYVGNVDSDDFELAKFKLYVKSAGTVPLVLMYKDDNNIDYNRQFTVELPIYSSEQLKRYGFAKTNYWPVFIILLLAVGVYWYFRRK